MPANSQRLLVLLYRIFRPLPAPSFRPSNWKGQASSCTCISAPALPLGIRKLTPPVVVSPAFFTYRASPVARVTSPGTPCGPLRAGRTRSTRRSRGARSARGACVTLLRNVLPAVLPQRTDTGLVDRRPGMWEVADVRRPVIVDDVALDIRLADHPVAAPFQPGRTSRALNTPCGPCGPVAPVGPWMPCGPVCPVSPLSPLTPCGPCGPVKPSCAQPVFPVPEVLRHTVPVDVLRCSEPGGAVTTPSGLDVENVGSARSSRTPTERSG